MSSYCRIASGYEIQKALGLTDCVNLKAFSFLSDYNQAELCLGMSTYSILRKFRI